MMAKKPQPAPLSVEQEQQFKYYWYAAKQAITEERYDEALVLLELCNAIQPNNGTTLCFLGVLYEGTSQRLRALETYRRAFEVDPRDQWYKYASMLIDIGGEVNIREAIRVEEKALKLNPKDENLLEQLKRLYMHEEQWAKALKMQDRIDAVKGYDIYSMIARYRIYALWGKPKKALEAIDQYTEQDPNNLQCLLMRAQMMDAAGVKKEELYATYDKILEFDPSNLSILNNYAYYLATHGGDLKRAERMSEITIREEPNNPVYLDTYGWILALQGQYNLADFYLHKARQNVSEETAGSLREIDKHMKDLRKMEQKAKK